MSYHIKLEQLPKSIINEVKHLRPFIESIQATEKSFIIKMTSGKVRIYTYSRTNNCWTYH